ncbi:MAG: anhydro-N-acetylmuramic acid kinase [Clostridia bacterium]|nr:anhydro-N-acetylmuramic acid kinase [Clostridia bacterium]
MIVIGIMSGTSADSIDAACLQIEGAPPRLDWEILSFVSRPMEKGLQEEIFACFRPETGRVDRLCQLNFALGEAFASAAFLAAEAAGLTVGQVDLIGCHGQTLWHVPPGSGLGRPSTLQLGNPAVIAERTGVTVVSDFRSRDMAAGGQGAPLVPFVDALLLRDAKGNRAVQNIGGIGNVTWLPWEGEVFGFDTGPGNMLLDRAAQMLTAGKLTCDLDGKLALAGRVREEILNRWMEEEPYFAMEPPKSTGRELFGVQRCDRYLREMAGYPKEDILATLTALTARSIARAYQDFLPTLPDEVLLCGGGAKNPAIQALLQKELPPCRISRTEDAGLPGDAKEAAAFAVLAYESCHRRPGNLPAATGARSPVVLGSITYGCG